MRRAAVARAVACAAAAVAVAAAGCAGQKQKGSGRAQGANQLDVEAATEATDECAAQLHDLIGGLLLYYFKNHEMPPTLADLRTTPGGNPNLPLACPISKQPYAYDPVGYPVPGKPHRLVVYDTAPVHHGGRWGVMMAEPEEGKPLSMWVVRLNEDVFKALVPAGGVRRPVTH